MAEKVYGRKLGKGAEGKKGKPAGKEAEVQASAAASGTRDARAQTRAETAAEKKPAVAEKKPAETEKKKSADAHTGKQAEKKADGGKPAEKTSEAGKKPAEAEKKKTAGKESAKTREENEKRRAERRKKFGRIEIKKQPKSEEAKRNAEAISEKWKPAFRGRFGKRWLRVPSKAKWNRWRAPRGIDMHCRQEDGMLPQPGYRTPVKIRHMHPSGYMEVLVGNLAEIKAAGRDKAVRIAGKIGRKKKRMMLEEAQKLGLRIVNP
ncbi:MAG: eL32 family ribosomal protein [Candidatus Diapherotrites archaeon]